jgi:hypothetical protein
VVIVVAVAVAVDVAIRAVAAHKTMRFAGRARGRAVEAPRSDGSIAK